MGGATSAVRGGGDEEKDDPYCCGRASTPRHGQGKGPPEWCSPRQPCGPALLDGVRALLSPAEAAYAERFRLPELLGDILVNVAQAALEDPTNLFLDLAVDAAEALHTMSTGEEHAARDEGKLVELLGRLCDGGPEAARMSARSLLAKHGVDSAAQGEEALVSWERVHAMLHSLEAAWGLDRRDTRQMLQQLKRGAFRMRREAASTPRVAGAEPSVGNHGGDCGLEARIFVDLWPAVLQKVRRWYQPHTETRMLHRKSFLRRATWTSADDAYEVKTEVGGGQSGTVALCVHKITGNLRALKTLPKTHLAAPLEHGAFINEFEVLARLDHPHIVRVFEVFEDAQAIHIAMEPVLGGSLKDAMRKRFDPPGEASAGPSEEPESLGRWTAEVIRQILHAIQYAHGNGVVHKDLKPHNVLLAEGSLGTKLHVIVCDFGIAEHAHHHPASGPSTGFSHLRFQQFGGTPFYIAPEVWKGDFSLKADLWSIGVILYEMLSRGQLPYKSKNMMALCREVTSPAANVDFSLTAAGGGRELCQLLLEKREQQRLSADEALTRCAPWLEGYKFNRQSTGNCSPASDSMTADCMRPVVSAIEHSRYRSHLDQCVMACVATQLNATSLSYLNETFERWDTDSSGSLDMDEMSRALAEMGVQGKEVDIMLKMLDTDGDGCIAYNEFVAGCLDMRRDQVIQHLGVVFSIFDIDRSGFLDRQELQLMLQPSEQEGDGTGQPAALSMVNDLLPDGSTLDEMLEELDTSGDGRISFEEFQTYLLRNITSG